MAKTLLTPKRKTAILHAIKLGAPWGQAAAAAGISPKTLQQWRRRGRAEDDGIYRDLVSALETAEALGIVHSLEVIERAANDGDWKAAAWRLERRMPHEYGRGRQYKPPPLTEEQQAELSDPPPLTLDVMSATWMRALQVAEMSFQAGELPTADYLRTISTLSGLAGRAIEIGSRQADAAEVPPIDIKVSLDSPHVAEPETPGALPGPCGDEIAVQ